MRQKHALIGLVVLLAGYMAGCGGSKGGGTAAAPAAPAEVRSASEIITPPPTASCGFTPSAIPAGGPATSTLQCTVTAASNTVVSSVAVDLSSIGGATSAALTASGTNTWRLTNISAQWNAAVQTNYPTITSTDALGSSGTTRATLRVVAGTNPKPVPTACVFSPYNPMAGVTSTTLTCTVTDANNNLTGVTVDLSSVGLSASTALSNISGSTWGVESISVPLDATVRTNYPVITATDVQGATGTTQATLIVRAYQAAPNPAPVVKGCAFSPSSIMSGGATSTTLTCTVTDANNNLSTVYANLSSIGIFEQVPLSNSGGSTWQASGLSAPVGATVRMNYPSITATDALGATGSSQASLNVTANINPKPVVSGCTFSPYRLYAGVGTNTSTLQCTVTDANNNLSSVSVNLSSTGGSAAASLTNMGGGVWRLTDISAGQTSSIGTLSPVITAIDSQSATGTSKATLIVVDPAPVVSSCAFSPLNIKLNGSTDTVLTCLVNDPNNNISTVTVDLSAIGGSPTAPLSQMGGSTWRATGITAGAPIGTYYPSTTATDSRGGTRSQAATVKIIP